MSTLILSTHRDGPGLFLSVHRERGDVYLFIYFYFIYFLLWPDKISAIRHSPPAWCKSGTSLVPTLVTIFFISKYSWGWMVHLKHLTWFQNVYPRSQQQLMHFFVTIPIRNSRFLSRNNKFYSYLIQLHLTQKINVINAYKYEITYSFHVIKLSKLSSTVILHVENIIVRYDKIYCSIGSRKRLFRTTMSTRYI